MKDLTVYYFTDNKASKILKAQTAEFSQGNIWNLKNVIEISTLNDANFPLIKTHEELQLPFKENAEDFGQFESDITTLNFVALFNFIRSLKETGINIAEYELMLFEKLAQALICIIFALFPVAEIFNPNRRASSMGKSIIFTLVFSIAFWTLHSAASAMGSSEKIPSIVAAFAVPLLFILQVLRTFLKNRQLA